MATAAEVAEFRQTQQDLVAVAQGHLVSAWQALDFEDALQAARTMEEAFPDLVATYGPLAADIAADFYDELRDQSPTASVAFTALLADAPSPEQSTGVARWATAAMVAQATQPPIQSRLDVPKVILGATPDETLRKLGGGLQRLVRQPARQTIADSVRSDPAKPLWARVPTGAETCAFCLVLASRGAVYTSLETAGDPEAPDQYHNDCDCEPVPIWRGDPLPEDYDPGALFEKYDAAREAAGSGDSKVILSKLRELEGIR